MSWSSRFLAELAKPVVYPLFVLESLRLGSQGRNGFKFSSFAARGHRDIIAAGGHSITPSELRPGTFDRTAGTLTIGLTDDPRANLWRGQVVQLRVGFPGWDLADFEPVFTGQIRGCNFREGSWSVNLVDLVAGLTSRFTEDLDRPTLFGELDDSNTVAYPAAVSELTAPFTPLSGSIAVDDSSLFQRKTGEEFVALVEPDGADPFYIGATTNTGTGFTGVVLGDLYGTTQAAALTGDKIRSVAAVFGHPLEIVRQILLSTGNGTNGVHDTLPTSWSYGLPRHLVAVADITQQIARCSPPGAPSDWLLLEQAPQTDGLSFLQGFLAPGGFWLDTRQGQITARGLVSIRKEPVHATITDDDLVAPPDYEAWDASLPIEHVRVEVRGSVSGTGTETDLFPATRPISSVRDLEVPVNDDDWCEYVANRVGQFYLGVPERLTVRCRGHRLAHLAAGDVVRLRTDTLRSLYAAQGHDFDDHRLLVLSVGADWFGGTTTIKLLSHPPKLP